MAGTMTPEEYIEALHTLSDADLDKRLGLYGDNDIISFGSVRNEDYLRVVEYFLDSGKWQPHGVSKERIRAGIALVREIVQLPEVEARKMEEGLTYDEGEILDSPLKTWYDYPEVSATCHFAKYSEKMADFVIGLPAERAIKKNPELRRVWQMGTNLLFHARGKGDRRVTAEEICDVVTFLFQQKIPFYARLERDREPLRYVLYDPQKR